MQHILIHEDMVYAARTAKLAFIVNVVLNGNHEIIGSFAGDMEKAHEKGCDFVRSLASVIKSIAISQSVRMVDILWIKIFIRQSKVGQLLKLH